MRYKSKLAVITAILLVFAMMPMSIFAAETDAARIGTTTYPTLQEAVDAAEDGDTVVLLKDLEGVGATVDDQGQDTFFTLDLNGKTIDNKWPGAVYIYSVGKLTIKNGTLKANSPDYATVTVEKGKLVIDNVTVQQTDTANQYSAIENQGGTVTLKSGSFSAASSNTTAIETKTQAITKLDTCSKASPSSWQGAQSFTVSLSTSPEAVIGKVKYASLADAISAVKENQTIILQKDLEVANININRANLSFTLDLNDKTIKGIYDPDVLDVDNVKTLTVKNGTVQCTDVVNSTPIAVASGTVILDNVTAEVLADDSHTSDGYALYANGTGEINIKSGSFYGNRAAVSTVPAIFIGGSNAKVTLNECSSANPSASWRTAHSFKVNYDPAASYRNKDYTTMQSALEAAKTTGGTVKIYRNIYMSGSNINLANTNSIILDLNGFIFDAEGNNPAITLTGSGNFTVKNGKITSEGVGIKTEQSFSGHQLTIDGVDIISSNDNAIDMPHGTLILKNGTFKTETTVPGVNAIAKGTLATANLAPGYIADTDMWVSTPSFHVGKDIAAVQISNIPDQTASGQAIEPALTVTDGNTVLTKDTDYTAAYSDNTVPGKATATIRGKGLYEGTQTVNFNILPARVTGLKVISRTTSANKLSWNASSNSDGYKVYIYGPTGKLVKTQNFAKNSATISGLKSGLAYSFKIRAFKTISTGQLLGTYSSEITSCALPVKVTLKALTTGKTHYVKASWKDITCSKYEVKIATNSKFTKGVKTYRLSDTSKKFTKLKKGKNYYVKVRAYTMMGSKKYYGAYSAVKYIKCK